MITLTTLSKASYDSLIALARAHLMEQGYHAHGDGAHEAEVAFLRTHSVPEHDVQLMNELRYRRNRILYYGDVHDAAYAKQCIELMKRLTKLT